MSDSTMPNGPTALKSDSEKLRMDLIEPLFIEGVAAVLTFGAKKYDEHNWRRGLTYSRLLGAIMRHTNAIAKGEDNDPETGLLHAYHIATSCMFLGYFQEKDFGVDLDNRNKTPCGPVADPEFGTGLIIVGQVWESRDKTLPLTSIMSIGTQGNYPVTGKNYNGNYSNFTLLGASPAGSEYDLVKLIGE
jgi:hypothetical protein